VRRSSRAARVDTQSVLLAVYTRVFCPQQVKQLSAMPDCEHGQQRGGNASGCQGRSACHAISRLSRMLNSCRLQKHIAYSKSVAVNSMAGYVIGLGDRHTQNILIDSCTAEVLHIDLGIAFEAGSYQPTPEKSPFRLTRDMVDGLGVSGVEGVMRQSSEATVAVLRKAQHAVITIVEVRCPSNLRCAQSRKRTVRLMPSLMP
jgi:hypothetical protein